MSSSPKILAFAGSLREQSWNKQLVKVAAEGAKEEGVDIEFVDLTDYLLPLFNQDIEVVETPSRLKELRQAFSSAQGLLIASPEYNGSFSGVLKNTLDWLSRPSEKEGYEPDFDKKVAGIMSASPGRLGGIRGLAHLRDVLFNMGSLVVPRQVAVPSSYEVFSDGKITNIAMEDKVKAIGQDVAKLLLFKR